MSDKQSRLWRNAWAVFVVVTAPVWMPGLMIGGSIATMAAGEEKREAERKLRR